MRYRLRTLLIVLALGPLAIGWLGINYRLVNLRRPFLSRFNDDSFPLRRVGLTPSKPIEDIPWIRRIMGDFSAGYLLYLPRDDKNGETLKRVRELFPEAKVYGWPHDDAPLPAGIERLASDVHVVI
jgi:hypothetical protein